MKTYYLILALLIYVTSFSQEKNSSDVDRLVNYMSGKFDSSRQAQNYDQNKNIQLIIIPIWKDRDEHWLYVEQAATSNPNEPHKQELYKISKSDDSTIMSQVYELKEPKKFIGKWKNPSFFDQMTTDDIRLRKGCAIYLEQEGRGVFKGSTKDKVCSKNLNGDKIASSIIEITPETITSRNVGNNDGDNKISDAKAGAYNFIKKESFK